MTDSLEPQTTLTSVADCKGESVAVDECTGNLYRGMLDLTVNWGDANSEDNITARIISLEGVCDSTRDWLWHDSQDAGTTFLSGIGIDRDTATEFSAGDAAAPGVRFRCRACGAEDGYLAGAATISGEFVGNGHSEVPLGVLGTWSIPETAANGLDFKGSFGADLKP